MHNTVPMPSEPADGIPEGGLVLERKPWIRLGVARSTVYELMKLDFPKPVKVGAGSRWIQAEVDAWIASRAALRGDGAVR